MTSICSQRRTIIYASWGQIVVKLKDGGSSDALFKGCLTVSDVPPKTICEPIMRLRLITSLHVTYLAIGVVTKAEMIIRKS